ncbi:MAG: cupin domain-containing protein [Alphaproteobacteria bacterium]|nr:cupin domain-containing protein [Alphaproteobacteria bacterium]
MRRIATAVTAAALAMLPAVALAEGDHVTRAFAQDLPNVPGKTMTAVVVDYAPGGASKSHRHAKSGFIFAYVLQGAIRSQVEGGPEKVYKAGEFWTEGPGAHHVVSADASTTEPARLLAVIVADPGDTLTSFDK